MNDYLKDFGERLLNITKDCRSDMHEPNEQNLQAFVIGNILDNAFGEEINKKFTDLGIQELIIILKRPDFDNKLPTNNVQGYAIERFNLATLIALARIGATYLLNKSENKEK